MDVVGIFEAGIHHRSVVRGVVLDRQLQFSPRTASAGQRDHDPRRADVDVIP
jgi:hypothetical protein